MMLFRERCQGVAGHTGDHWCFRPDGSYHYRPHDADPTRKDIGCGTIPSGHADYRTPLEMSRYHYLEFYEDSEVTNADVIARLEREELLSNESLNMPCNEEQVEELRRLGRLETNHRRERRERAE